APLLGYTGYLLPDEATLDPHVFANFMQKHQCSRALTTPSLLVTLMDSLSQNFATKLSSMRTWMMCGEVLPMKVANRFRETLPRCKLINDYSTWESGDIGYALVAPAGRYEPSQVFAVGCQDLACGVSACIIDPETKKTMPRGLVGELYVGGPVLSFGYQGQIEATAAKFSEGANGDMVALSQGKWRWYKTGDAARFVGDPPVLEIRGRIDSTVKIRGFKVGIPVVEAAIAQVPGVALCAVVPVYETPTAVDSLLCFVKAEEGMVYDELVQKIKREAVKELPRWM
ncbi:tycC, partial [Symbiodinium sp. CCMP2456]